MIILVVDDEHLARERLLRLLPQVVNDAEYLEAGNGQEALKLIGQHNPDLVLLDIQMPGLSGIEVAATLNEASAAPAIIFCTAYDKYALAALQQNATAYLLKPVRKEELQTALDNASRLNRMQLEQLSSDGGSQARSFITSQTADNYEPLPVDEVRCFVAEDKYVIAITPHRELRVSGSLKELEQEYGEQFLRVHRNTLVAMKHIERLERGDGGAWRVILKDIKTTPNISRRHLNETKKAFSALPV